jgi:hypothetical protein
MKRGHEVVELGGAVVAFRDRGEEVEIDGPLERGGS